MVKREPKTPVLANLLLKSLPEDPFLNLFCSEHLQVNFLERLDKFNVKTIITSNRANNVQGVCILGKLSIHLLLGAVVRTTYCVACVRKRLKVSQLSKVVSGLIYTLTKQKRKEDEIELLWIAVTEEVRGQGVGSMLIDECQKVANSKSVKLTVKTLSKTPRNISFYIKNNFRITNIRLGRVELVHHEAHK